jgi:hypothetical protein
MAVAKSTPRKEQIMATPKEFLPAPEYPEVVQRGTFERTKSHTSNGTIGHVDHGKTTLAASIAFYSLPKLPKRK